MNEINVSFIYDHIDEITNRSKYDQVMGMIRMAGYAKLINNNESKELKAAALAKLNEIEC